VLEKYNAIKIKQEKKSGVYILCQNEKVVYVGVSHDVHVRLWQHRDENKKRWDCVKWIEEKDYYKALCIESELILHYKPFYNKARIKLEYHESINGRGAKYNKSNYPKGWRDNIPKEEYEKEKREKELKRGKKMIEKYKKMAKYAELKNDKKLLKYANFNIKIYSEEIKALE
jgi:hypothetical protein